MIKICNYITPCLISSIRVSAGVLTWTVSIIQETFVDVQTRDGATVARITLAHEGSRSIVTQLVTASIVEVTLVHIQTRVSILGEDVSRMTVTKFVLHSSLGVTQLAALTHVTLVTPVPGGVSDLG